ncbi:hypothetical protein FPRO05_04476 [Fusarium proliferatum]|uniref:F-box domain-containing protein n=1 Tax=Gibberella intermedia TaxID=948311 RepID=A0A365MRX9_GIBIN|nr:hypothetical protein FPRO05_04476 [Fusarium proliferatum]
MTQSRLLRLPPEVLLLMTEDDSLEWEDLCRLRHVCCFFFHSLVDGFREGNFSVERFKQTWQWLSDHGYELSYSVKNTGDAPGHYRPFSADLLFMVWDANDAGRLQAICDVIHFVVDKGFMMAIHCPASILKLFLKQLHDQGLTLKSLTNNQVYKGETTEISAFLWEMFRYIFDSVPPILEEDDGDMARVLLRLEDPNGIVDNFGDKVKALIEYKSVDDGEARVLKDVWGRLQKMARKRIERGFLDFDQDGLWYCPDTKAFAQPGSPPYSRI